MSLGKRRSVNVFRNNLDQEEAEKKYFKTEQDFSKGQMHRKVLKEFRQFYLQE
jgi:hypothetical protein